MSKSCSVCDKPARDNGLCPKHASRMRRTGTTELRPKPAKAICIVEGCGQRAHAMGRCQRHYLKDYQLKHKDQLAQNARKYYDDNMADIKAYVKFWQSGTLSGRWSHFRATAKQRGLSVSITKDLFNTITSSVCSYCGGFSSGKGCTGVDRVDSSIGYSTGNVVACCDVCNFMKSDHQVDEWLSHVRKILSFIDGRASK